MYRMILAMVLIATPTFGGELSRRDIRRSTEWEPSGCNKPSEPSFYVSDVDSFNQAVDEFNNYRTEVETYIQCIDSEASDDFQTLKRVLEDSLSNRVSQSRSELDSVKSSLERQRP
jgi:hypothetical protein